MARAAVTFAVPAIFRAAAAIFFGSAKAVSAGIALLAFCGTHLCRSLGTEPVPEGVAAEGVLVTDTGLAIGCFAAKRVSCSTAISLTRGAIGSACDAIFHGSAESVSTGVAFGAAGQAAGGRSAGAIAVPRGLAAERVVCTHAVLAGWCLAAWRAVVITAASGTAPAVIRAGGTIFVRSTESIAADVTFRTAFRTAFRCGIDTEGIPGRIAAEGVLIAHTGLTIRVVTANRTVFFAAAAFTGGAIL